MTVLFFIENVGRLNVLQKSNSCGNKQQYLYIFQFLTCFTIRIHDP